MRDVLHKSLTTTVMAARWLRRKNAKVLRLDIEESERLVMQKETAKAKAARLTKEQASAVRRLVGIISSSSGSGTTSTNDDDAPPAEDSTRRKYRLQ